MILDSEKVIELIENIKTKQDILDLVNILGVEANENKTVLYSGGVNIDKYLANSNTNLINKTQLAQVLDIEQENKYTDSFKRALEKVFNTNNDPNFDVIAESRKRGSLDGKVPPSELNKFLYDVGKKDSGLWDIASKRFVSGIKGEVLTAIGDNALTTRTFYQTELPELLKNKNITKINGMDKAEFTSKLNSYATDREKLNFIISDRKTVLEITGKSELYELNQKDFETARKNIKYNEILHAKTKDLISHQNKTVNGNAEHATGNKKPTDTPIAIGDNEKNIDKIARDIVNNEKMSYSDKIKELSKFGQKSLPKVFNVLNKAGTAGLILGAGVASYEVAQAIKDGDTKRASEIIGEYGASMGGGYLTAKAALATVGGTATLGTALLTMLISAGGSELVLYLYKNRDILLYFINPADDRWDGKTPFADFWSSMLKGERSPKEILEMASYLFNPFDPNWKGRDSEDIERFKVFWSPYLDDPRKFLQDAKNFYSQLFSSIFNFSIYDPLALDLNGDGKIGISPAPNGGAYFDHNGDGVSHKSSWISKEDGILAYDRNGNGKIDDGGELFGNFTQIKDKEGNQRLAKDGYEALKEFDSNNDGLIDNKDDKFKDLKIWQDANSNGISDEGELKSLDELGIASLSLNHNEVNEDLGGGNTLSLKGSYIKTDGTAHSMGDLNFNVDTINSKFKDETPLSSEDMARANIKGFGLLRDLRSAAALNKELASALDSYSRLNTKEEQLKALPGLIKAWSETAARSTGGNSNGADYEVSLKGVKLPSNVSLGAGSNINVDADGNVINSGNPNARRLSLTPSQYQALLNSSNSIDESLLKEFESIKYKIKVIDAFTGSKTAELYYISNDDIKAIIKNTNETYEKILNYSYASLLAQTRLKSYADLISLDMISVPNDTAVGGNSKSDTASGGANASAKPKYDFRLNFTKVIDKFKEINLSDPKKAFVDLAEFTTLFQSKKEFAAGLSLLAEFAYGANKRGVLSEYLDTLGKDMQSKINIATSPSGSAGDDIMVGSENNDSLIGGNGNDILIGGAGNDRLEGSDGDDTYIFNKGDGQDTIQDFGGTDTIEFGEGISLSDLIVRRTGFYSTDMTISIRGTNDGIEILDVFTISAIPDEYKIEKFKFHDGTTLSFDEFWKQTYFQGTEGNDNIRGTGEGDKLCGQGGDDSINGEGGNDIIYGGDGNDDLEGSSGNDILYGGEGRDSISGGNGEDILYGEDGNDSLIGGNGNDILIGGAGNDRLEGSDGDDTYIFNKGDGQDTIQDFGGTDTIEFGEGISLSDLIVRRTGFYSTDMTISIRGTNDGIEILDVFTISAIPDEYKIEKFKFHDGTTLSFDEFWKQTYFQGTEGNDVLRGNNEDNTLYGNGGDDRLEGGEGNDTYVFGKGDGNDTISDTSGENKIKFKEGIKKENITFQRVDNDLLLKYGDNDTVRINNQFGGSSIEQIALASGEYITASKINKIIEDLNAYAANNGMSNISMEDMKNNPDIMQMFASGWGN